MAEDVISPRQALQSLPMGQQLQKLQQDAETARDKLKAMAKALNAMVVTAEAHQQSVLNFAETIVAVGGVDILQKSRDLVVERAAKQVACVHKQEEHMMSMVKDIVEVRIATALGMQAKVHEAIKEHEAANERLHGLKKGSPKLVEAQAHLATTQQHMDLLSFAYMNKLKQTNLDISLALIEKLVYYFGEETVASMAVNSSTAGIVPELTKQQAELKKQRHSNEEERAREMKKHENLGAQNVSASTASNALQIKQGLIFCKVSGKFRQRWVSILNARLMVYKNWKATEAEKVFNLVLCNVKRVAADSSSSSSTHQNVFEIRSNLDDHMLFAATDEFELSQWVTVVQNNIAAQLTHVQQAINKGNNNNAASNASAANGNTDAHHLISAVKGNDKCADCRAPDPEWISYNLGITICIECSGVHRSFGSHVSKVRSMKLDNLEPELVLLMTSIGNAKANAKVFESTLPADYSGRPGATSERSLRESFLRSKYVEKKWLPDLGDWQTHWMALMRRKHPFKPTTVLAALVHPNADINWRRDRDQRTLLHKCVLAQNFASTILLLKRECSVDPADVNGMTPLHIAAQINAAPMARLLIQHGAALNSLDSSKRTPRDVAIAHDALDCIQLLSDDSQTPGNNDSALTPSLPIPSGGNSSSASNFGTSASNFGTSAPNFGSMISPRLHAAVLAPPGSSPPVSNSHFLGSDFSSGMSRLDRDFQGEIRHQPGAIPNFSHRLTSVSSGGGSSISPNMPSPLSAQSSTPPSHGADYGGIQFGGPPNLDRSGPYPGSHSAMSSINISASAPQGAAAPTPTKRTKKPSPSTSVSSATLDTSSSRESSLTFSPTNSRPKAAPDSPQRSRQSLSLRSPAEEPDSIVHISSSSENNSKDSDMGVSRTSTDEKRTNMRRSKSAKVVPSAVNNAPLPAAIPLPAPIDSANTAAPTASTSISKTKQSSEAPAVVALPPPPVSSSTNIKESRKTKRPSEV